ncbi:MAG: hypothetical protein ACLFNU_07725, partial [Bacteroidales bacterium]
MKRVTLITILSAIWFSGYTLDTPTISTPANNATNLTPDVLLQVNSVSGATSYEFELDVNEDFSSSVIYVSSTRSYRPGNLMYGQTYYWRVKAKNDSDESDWSEQWPFSINEYGATPSNPSNEAIDRPVELTLSVNKVSGSTTIEYELDTLPTFDSGNLQTYDHSDSYSGKIISNLDYGQKYYWRVRGYHAEDVSEWSETREFTTDTLGARPTSPTNGAEERPVRLTLSVDRVSGSTTIEYELDTLPTFDSGNLQTYDHSDSYSGKIISNLDYGQKYYWRVRGYHAEDVSEWSETREFT